jgi:hypothetical protein
VSERRASTVHTYSINRKEDSFTYGVVSFGGGGGVGR